MELTLRSSRTAPAYPEQTLVSAARRGDDRAFEELYSRYRQRIFAFILSRVRDHGRAEDIAQEVFISALRRLRASDQPIAFKPWIYEIAKNACIDEFRRGSRSPEVSLEPDDEPGSGGRPMMAIVPTPPDAVENRQRLDDLRGAFGGLSESHHQLLVLREFEGLSYDEIGERLGMTRQMVESGLFRARRKLTEEYDELASGRRCTQIQTAIESGSAQSITSLGVRERRRFARHLSHCQPCRHTARMAGVDEALLKPRSVRSKIAALLPFPLWRWPWGGGRGRGTATNAAGHSGRGVFRAPLRGAARVAHPAGSSVPLGQVAAVVAALAVAGGGAGIVIGSQHHNAGPSAASLAADSSVTGAHTQSPGSSSTTWPGAALTPAGRAASEAALSVKGTGLFIIPSQSGLPGSPSGGNGSPSGAPGTGTGPTGSPVGGLPFSGAAGSAAATGAGVLKNSVNPTVAGAKGTVNSTLSGIKKTVGSATSGLKSTLGSATSGVKSTVGSATSGVKSTVGSATSGVKSTVGSATSGVKSTVGSATSGVKSTVGSATSGVKSTVGSATSGVKSTVGSATSGVKSTVGSATSGVKSTVGSATSGVKSVGSQVSGVAGAIDSATKPASSGASASGASVPKATGSATKAGGAGSSTSTAASPASVVHSVTAPVNSVVSGVLSK